MSGSPPWQKVRNSGGAKGGTGFADEGAATLVVSDAFGGGDGMAGSS